ncbi:PREDICTED: BCL2/adenovirus E1B 19 kDa protein-interacting protein 3 isoform X1 [Cercocebus atys]|uniref:BCL2/adenovirus E1B 19 kDa protein-interacting protein 3 isoform X1 n=1 Tax=Cercocebus atys TaxID=9531 RepID=UPI0005F461E3|nr:PREDICTED: BCL2/adenovirus E1B 19 kDa protein-interacting protein 3 isoform X1 [Cercocebus atys]
MSLLTCRRAFFLEKLTARKHSNWILATQQSYWTFAWYKRTARHGQICGLSPRRLPSCTQRVCSWVELHFSNNGNGSSVPASVSIYNGDMEKILLDAQHESGRSSSKSSHCDSPPRSQTPQDTNRASETDTHSIGEKNSSQSEEDDIERRKEVESILKKNSDWIWDWSSRPENIPPKEFLFKHPKRTATLSMRNTSVMKKGGIFSAEFLKVFLPSLLLSHLLAIGLGIYIGRRLTTSTSTF